MNSVRVFREDLVAGAKLSSSNFHKKHPAKVYKHFQDRGHPKPGNDDFHSPVQPHRYITLRVTPTMSFYENRIPKYICCSKFFKITIVILSVAASAVARFDLGSLAIAVTSAAAAITSWTEFSDMGSKSERYTRAMSSLKNVLDWWSSLTAVQKASRESIERLVISCESIIAKEQLGWTSMAQKRDGNADDSENQNNVGTAVRAGSRVHPVSDLD